MVSRTWSYTVNNYDDNDIAQFKAFDAMRHRCALEVGESGTPHMQGAITFSKSYRLAGLKKLNPKAHWEPAKVVTALYNYVTKGEIIIDYNNAKPGTRTDIAKAEDLVKAGRSLYDIKAECPEVFYKYSRAIKESIAMQDHQDGKKIRDVEVYVLVGEPGSGKTRFVYDNFPMDSIYSLTINKTLWFDRYEREDVLLIDDFDGEIDYRCLLRLLDRYPMKLEVKGSCTYAAWTKVFITSNRFPGCWYQDTAALNRRLKKVYQLHINAPFHTWQEIQNSSKTENVHQEENASS